VVQNKGEGGTAQIGAKARPARGGIMIKEKEHGERRNEGEKQLRKASDPLASTEKNPFSTNS